MYRQTSLWKRTIGSNEPRVAQLRNNYEKARDNVTFLLDKIRKDFPFLTLHDITHVDSLWRVADTILGDKYPINPFEGYLLGISFLIHDIALSYDAVGGKARLRSTNEWIDAYSSGCPAKISEDEFIKKCDFDAIRLRHAREAETILDAVFPNRNGKESHILGEDDFGEFIRHHFGQLIGLIAASHNWDIEDIASRLEQEKDPVEKISLEWRANIWKIACILRCADAGHIDNGRAPDRLFKYLILNGVSLDHWEAQRHLCVVSEDTMDKDYLRVQSTRPFPKTDCAAWNVAYEAVRMLDSEIRKSNALLKPLHLSFPHMGVSGASSKAALKQYVLASDWEPADVSVHASDIKALIEDLGGNNLYNEDPLIVALRELIQNSRDAIHARSRIRKSFSLDEGKICIKYEEHDGRRIFEVSDNGIGMSLACIKEKLLDFGSSYWKSSLSKFENPGLLGSGFSPVGKFGIGFFSVFMVAKSVTVWTKRFDQNVSPLCVEFMSGMTLSPIISKSKLDETLSTRIRIELKDEISLTVGKGFLKGMKPFYALPILAVGLDANLYYEENDVSRCIHQNVLSVDFDLKRWFNGLMLQAYSKQNIKNRELIKDILANLTILKDEHGSIRGIIAPPPYDPNFSLFDRSHLDNGFFRRKEREESIADYLPSLLTIGGLSVREVAYRREELGRYDFIGYLDCKPSTISRESAQIDDSFKKLLRGWVKQNYRKNFEKINKAKCTSEHYGSLVDYCGLREELLTENELMIYSGQYSFGSLPLPSIRCVLFIDNHLMPGIEDSHVSNLSSPSIWGIYNKYPWLDVDERLVAKAINQASKSTDTEELKQLRNKLKSLGDAEIERLQVVLKKKIQNPHSIDDIMRMLFYLLRNYGYCFDKEAIYVWANLMLNNLEGIMIDWREALKKAEEENDTRRLFYFVKPVKYCISLFRQFIISSEEYIDKLERSLSQSD